ncbi:MAG: hypothetical protein FWG64_13475 [Firmicutes bacterium]|nr:hypothetical protein [Bacillota bacterium]
MKKISFYMCFVLLVAFMPRFTFYAADFNTVSVGDFTTPSAIFGDFPQMRNDVRISSIFLYERFPDVGENTVTVLVDPWGPNLLLSADVVHLGNRAFEMTLHAPPGFYFEIGETGDGVYAPNWQPTYGTGGIWWGELQHGLPNGTIVQSFTFRMSELLAPALADLSTANFFSSNMQNVSTNIPHVFVNTNITGQGVFRNIEIIPMITPVWSSNVWINQLQTLNLPEWWVWQGTFSEQTTGIARTTARYIEPIITVNVTENFTNQNGQPVFENTAHGQFTPNAEVNTFLQFDNLQNRLFLNIQKTGTDSEFFRFDENNFDLTLPSYLTEITRNVQSNQVMVEVEISLNAELPQIEGNPPPVDIMPPMHPQLPEVDYTVDGEHPILTLPPNVEIPPIDGANPNPTPTPTASPTPTTSPIPTISPLPTASPLPNPPILPTPIPVSQAIQQNITYLHETDGNIETPQPQATRQPQRPPFIFHDWLVSVNDNLFFIYNDNSSLNFAAVREDDILPAVLPVNADYIFSFWDGTFHWFWEELRR